MDDILPIKHHYVIEQISLFDMNIQMLFEQYHQAYLNSDMYQQFVASSERIPDELRQHDYIGLSERKVGIEMPVSRTLEGGSVRGSLKQAKLFHSKGGELFRGCIIFPISNTDKKIIAAIGYRFGKRIRHGQHSIIHWDRPTSDDFMQDGFKLAREVYHEKTYH